MLEVGDAGIGRTSLQKEQHVLPAPGHLLKYRRPENEARPVPSIPIFVMRGHVSSAPQISFLSHLPSLNLLPPHNILIDI